MKRSDSILLNFYRGKLPKYQDRPGTVNNDAILAYIQGLKASDPKPKPISPEQSAAIVNRINAKNPGRVLVATNTPEVLEAKRKEKYAPLWEAEEREAKRLKEERAAAAKTRERVIGGDENATFTFPDGVTKKWKDMGFREQQYVVGKNMGSWNNDNWTDWINPIAWIGSMGEGLATSPYTAQKTDSYLPYVTGVGAPLLAGVLGGVGAKSTGQFVENLVNPIPARLSNVGQFLTEKTPLQYAYKLNPKAFTASPNMLYRGIGEEGLADVLEAGYFRGKQNVPRVNFPGTNLNASKSFGNTTYWSPKFETAAQYGQGVIAEVPKDVTKFLQKYRKSDWSQFTTNKIPLDQATILRKHWWEGYKPINISGNKSINLNAASLKSSIIPQSSFTSYGKIPPEKWKDMTGFLQRRQFIKQLQQEGLIGKEFSAADLNYAARSTDKTNALTKLALDRYHTGFRNVSGEIPTGGIGRQSYTGREFNMNEPAWGQTISEIDNMKKAGVDLNDPKSIAEYQATYIPLEDYGYRSTGESPTSTYGFLFRSDVPSLNQEYGDYIFKGLPKTDYSVGNYADWYNNFYKNLKYHSSNNSVGPIRKIDLSETMQWGKKPGVTRATLVGPRGTKAYDVDKTFPFQNVGEILSNPELKKSFDEYLNKFISQYKTGWRGEYKQGGPIVNSRGFMDGQPPKGSNWRIPGDTLYNPTPNKIRAISDNGIEKILNPFDEKQVEFPGAKYIDEYKMKMGGLSPNKAREILHDGTVHGRPLTEKQRRFFGAMSKGHTKNYQLGGNALAMLRDYGGGMSVPGLNSPVPKAQLGSLLRSASPIISPMLELTKIFTGVTGDKKETVSEKPKVPEVTLERYFNIVDPRKVRATTGQPINPNVDLVAGLYPTRYITQELKLAKQKGLSKEDAWNLAAIAFQESGWGKTDDNLGHVLGPAGKGDYGSTLINAYMNKMKEADRLKITDPYTRLQVYNGLGKIFPSTEQKYHGFKMKKIYGVPVPQGGLNLRDNPLYGKQVVDIRENVLKQNPKLVEYIDSLYKKNGGKFLPMFQTRGQYTPRTHYVFAEAHDSESPFIKEANDLKSFVQKNYPNDKVVVLPGYQTGNRNYKSEVEQTLKGVTPNDYVYLFGHHGSRYAGIPVNDWGSMLQSTNYQNCFLGSCSSEDLVAYGKEEYGPYDRDYLETSKNPRAFSKLKNFYFRPRGPWLGVNPNVQKSDDQLSSILNAMYSTTAMSNDKKHHSGLERANKEMKSAFNRYELLGNEIPLDDPNREKILNKFYKEAIQSYIDKYQEAQRKLWFRNPIITKKLKPGFEYALHNYNMLQDFVPMTTGSPKKETLLGIQQFSKGGQHGGLDRWFAEKWVDVKTGKPCGRQEGESRAYPACRPSRRVSSKTPKTSGEMSSSEKAKFKSSKTSSQRIPYNHKRR